MGNHGLQQKASKITLVLDTAPAPGRTELTAAREVATGPGGGQLASPGQTSGHSPSHWTGKGVYCASEKKAKRTEGELSSQLHRRTKLPTEEHGSQQVYQANLTIRGPWTLLLLMQPHLTK